jgi:hypothetical protein
VTVLKKCCICKDHKSIDNFSRNRSRTDGLQSQCKPCNIKRASARRNDVVKELHSHKVGLECLDCGENHPATLDFHHTGDEKKLYGVSAMAYQGFSLDKVKHEISKCIVLCSNCHRKHHWNERLNKNNGR